MASGAAYHCAFLHATQRAFLEAHELASHSVVACSLSSGMTTRHPLLRRCCVSIVAKRWPLVKSVSKLDYGTPRERRFGPFLLRRIQVTVETLESRGNSVVRVCDSGPGVPEESLQEIFRPFYRVDSARQSMVGGFGVVLAIADRAVRIHGGQSAPSTGKVAGSVSSCRCPALVQKPYRRIQTNNSGSSCNCGHHRNRHERKRVFTRRN
jgi:hypothetical protein